MKKLLFILPLLLWVGCEDDSSESTSIDGSSEYTFINEWFNCKISSYTTQSSDGTVLGDFYNWNGLTATYGNNEVETFNEYGFTTRYTNSDSSTIWIYNYIDKWKLVQEIFISDGDTVLNWNYEWDGLTRIDDYSGGLTTYEHNEFGKLLRREQTLDDGSSYSLQEYEYMDDQRRELSRKSTDDIGVEAKLDMEWLWDGNNCTYKWFSRDDNNFLNTQQEWTINEYYEITRRTNYSIQNGELGDIEWTIIKEFECSGFEQVYP